MKVCPRALAFSILLILVTPAVARARPTGDGLIQGRILHPSWDGARRPVRLTAGPRVAARWLGQDRNDFVGDRAKLGPNGVQDIHVALGGIPPRVEVTGIVISGYGGDQWDFPLRASEYAFTVVVRRKPRAPSADLFFEPNRVETGREFNIKLKFSDGSDADLNIKGGKADPNLRTAASSLAARWAGQEKADHVGPGPGVGPDGFVDARIVLSKLATNEAVQSVLVEEPAGGKWAAGPNPEGHSNAEFVADPKAPGEGSLYLHPDRDLAGRKIRLTVTYPSGKADVTTLTAGKTDPKLASPRPTLPKLAAVRLSARWLGQDGAAVFGPGDVRVALSGVSLTKPIAAAVLSDGVRGTWAFKADDRLKLDTEPDAMPLSVRRGAGDSGVLLAFPPYRDETGATMTLRVVYRDGEIAVGSFPGGACDPGRRAKRPDGPTVTAKPGDDLNALASRGGTVNLSKGFYELRSPLILPRPVTLAGEPGAVLRFTQGADRPEWTAAIKIHEGGTTLRGFAVKFAGPVRWKRDVSYGPAVIGTTDNLDRMPDLDKPGLVFEGLDLESPPASKPQGWEEAPRLLRLTRATGGRLVKNTLNGGTVELFGGPWRVEGNVYTGCPAASFTPAVFAVHDPHDVVVRDNKARPQPLSGKAWRFLLFTNRGAFDRVENNTVVGIGPRDDDAIPGMNAPEIILTESYHLRFEGRPAAVSPEGRVVRLPRTQGEAPRTGDVLSVLSGPGAGQWIRVAKRLDPTTILLESALPKGAEVVSVAPGFVNEVFAGNSIDAKGGRAAAGFVLAGNHFGTAVQNNKVVGAGDAFLLYACPTEQPVAWGWSHAPFLGGRFEGNTVEDSERGARLGTQHDGPIKSTRGRVYMTLTLKGNTVVWSDAFVKNSQAAGLGGVTVGFLPSLDPNENVIDARDDRLTAPASAPRTAAFRVNAARLNGQTVTRRTFDLPLPSSPPTASGSGLPRR